MKEAYVHLALVKNKDAQRFEMKVDDYTAIIEYEQSGDRITLIHTEVPPELEGKGAATAIIEKTLQYVEQNHFRLIPLCPFVVAYIRKHREWERIVYAG